MRIQFSLSQSPAARKAFRIEPSLKSAMKQAAKLVVETDIPEVTEFRLGVVALSDEELLQLNISSLGHDWYTDIITFELEREVSSEGVVLEAELYISVDRALENAKKARISAEKEMVHLVIHGTLHLAGHDDHDPARKKRMVARERFYLAKVFNGPGKSNLNDKK